MNLHRFLRSAPSFESLQVVVGINFHGALRHLPIDVHRVQHVVNLPGITVEC